MRTEATRRAFRKTAGGEGAVLSAGPLLAECETGMTVTLAFVGCTHFHTPGFIRLLIARKDARVKYVRDHDAEVT